MEEAGLAEAIAEAVRACHPQLHALLWSNILLTGQLWREGWWGQGASHTGRSRQSMATPALSFQALRPGSIQDALSCSLSLVGGVAACPGFRERLEAELRPLVPDDYTLGLCVPEEPASVAWRGEKQQLQGMRGQELLQQ